MKAKKTLPSKEELHTLDKTKALEIRREAEQKYLHNLKVA